MSHTPIDNLNWKDAKLISNQLLWLRRDKFTTPMQIIKLVYICHGWMLGLADEELINEPVEAWRYGPVVPSLYHEFKRFGGLPISVPVEDMRSRLTRMQNTVIESIHEVYENVSGAKLSSLTHKPGTPWHQVQKMYGIGAIIPSPIIRDYYSSALRREATSAARRA